VKVWNPANYTEIQHETFPWEGDALLPKLAVSRVGNVTIKIDHCTIHNGNAKAKICLDVRTATCKLADGHQSLQQECLLPSLSVGGTFGDATYRYVTMKVYAPKGSKDGKNKMSVWWEQRESPTWTGVLTQLYTWSEKIPMKSELFFQKVTALQGESFGLFGRSGNDESEDLLQQKHYMVKKSEYSYAGEIGEANSQGLVLGQSLYFRAAHTMREDFYEVYSVLRLLESLGGLYTSFSFILFVPIICAYKLLRNCSVLLDYCSRRRETRSLRRATEVLVEEINVAGHAPEGSLQHPRLETERVSLHAPHARVEVVPEVSENRCNSEPQVVKLPGMMLT